MAAGGTSVVTPEHVIEAERIVLGAMLKDAPSVDIARAVLNADDFHDPALGRVFTACCDYRDEHPTVKMDYRVIALAVQPDIKLDELIGMVRGVIGIGNVRTIAQRVLEAATIRRYSQAAYTTIAAIEAGHDARSIEQTALNAVQAASGAHRHLGLEAVPYETLMGSADPEYDWVVEGFLDRGDRFVLTGHEGLGKSILLRQAAVMTSAGLNFVTGKPMKPARVLVVDVENSERMWRKTTRMVWEHARDLGHNVEDRLHVACHGRLNITRADHRSSLYRLIDHHAPDMVVIGPLYKLTDKAITSDDDAAPVISALDGIRDRGITIMLETHMGHSTSLSLIHI